MHGPDIPRRSCAQITGSRSHVFCVIYLVISRRRAYVRAQARTWMGKKKSKGKRAKTGEKDLDYHALFILRVDTFERCRRRARADGTDKRRSGGTAAGHGVEEEVEHVQAGEVGDKYVQEGWGA